MTQKMSTSMIIAVVLLFQGLFASAQNSTQPSITLNITPALTQPGNNVTITCRSRGLANDVAMKYGKVVIHSFQQVAHEVISNQLVLEKLYRETGRYHLSETTDGEDKIYILKIDSVETMDSGDYACVAAAEQDMKAIKMLEVYKPPSSISFIGYNTTDVIDMDEGIVFFRLQCRVAFVQPAPEMRIMTPSRDVTNDFFLDYATNVLCGDVADYSKTCPLHSNINMSAESVAFRPTYADDGKRLTCRATMRQFDKHSVNTSVVLNVRHAPRISCKQENWVAIMDSKNVRLNCIISANPPASVRNKTLIVKPHTPDEAHLNPGDISAEYQIQEEAVDGSPRSQNLSFVITVASKKYFGDYVLRVTNELGSAEKQMTLKVTSPPAPSRAASTSTYTIYMILLTAYLLVGHVMYSR